MKGEEENLHLYLFFFILMCLAPVWVNDVIIEFGINRKCIIFRELYQRGLEEDV